LNVPNEQAQAEARKVARILLSSASTPDVDTIRATCEQVRPLTEARFGAGTVDVEKLVEYFLSTTNIFVAPLQSMSDSRGHVDWLQLRRGEISWKFWERYQIFLESIEELPKPVVTAVDLRTEGILELLEDPTRSGPWDRRGLVVGSVQSGKTGNFLGLACKAIDAGYKLVIILAGIHNSLRAQTQIRMEEGLLGYNTDSSLFWNSADEKVGVGKLLFEDLHVNSMTSRSETGDFNSRNLGATVRLGETPFIVVVKKHATILKNLTAWITKKNGTETADGKRLVRDLPMLLIDDEADHSSINTKKAKQILPDGVTAEEIDPTRINMRIRELLSAFEKCAYVGYTATPFANIFVDPDATHKKLGDDLFPRSFIVSLPPPDNYFSVEKVFGRDGDPDSGLERTDGLPLTRIVDDFSDVFPEKAKADFVPDRLPGSLRKAILAFILVCTARFSRGQGKKHNSMLVHVARFVEAQRRIVELVTSELLFLQRRIANEGPQAAKAIREELRQIWESDFMPTTSKVDDDACPVMTWAQIEPNLQDAAKKIRVLEINGTSADILDYEKHRGTGISVIAVGGDKLSRGLTLDGLSVSYYMRVSKMYDSLLQMGRWFGYRPGFVDLCRIYTSRELIGWYRHIALAEAELRREFERMAALRATPEEYGLRVRTHPDGMLVTALNKSRASKIMQVSFEGTLAQCVQLDTRDGICRKNRSAVAALVKGIGDPIARKGNSKTRVWIKVPAEAVCTFLDEFASPMGTNGFDASRISQFVRRQQPQGELVEWTVALISATGGNRESIAGLDIGLVTRGSGKGAKQAGDRWELPNSNVLNPIDQAIDLEEKVLDRGWISHLLSKRVFLHGNSEERNIIEDGEGRKAVDIALEISLRRFESDRVAGRTRPNQKAPKAPLGAAIRDVRATSHGLLLLYPLDSSAAGLPGPAQPIITCALSFPTSATATPIQYQVNEVYQKLQLSQIEEADDDD
jgi:hypothetical protein